MSAAIRTPRELLGELGRDLDAAFRTPRRVRWRRPAGRSGRLAVALGLLVVLGVSTAAATTSIFSSSPPLPRLAPRAVVLGAGVGGGRAWELLVSGCERPQRQRVTARRLGRSRQRVRRGCPATHSLLRPAER